MQAIGAVTHALDRLTAFETNMPVPRSHDLLVRIEAVGVNPVDTKVRKSLGHEEGSPRILGWDAAGTVVGVGDQVTDFQEGDEVFYSGDVTRPGSNADYQCVDSHMVAHKPTTVGFEEAAAWPLVSITAWELLFERMGIDLHGGDAGKTLLVINGAGGVGSVAIQLAKEAGLVVVATASRPETVKWCESLGADQVIDHRESLLPQLVSLGMSSVAFIANFHEPSAYWEQMGEMIAPLGVIGMIVEPEKPVAIGDPFKAKCVRFAWEFMFARSKFNLPDLARQGEILEEIACRIEADQLKAIHTRVLEGLSVENLREAHTAMEAGNAFGKWVIRHEHNV